MEIVEHDELASVGNEGAELDLAYPPSGKGYVPNSDIVRELPFSVAVVVCIAIARTATQGAHGIDAEGSTTLRNMHTIAIQ